MDWAGIHVVSAAQKNDSPCRNTDPSLVPTEVSIDNLVGFNFDG